MQRLRAGLPLGDEVRDHWVQSPYSIQQLTALLQSEVDRARAAEGSVLVFRMNHRPFGLISDDERQLSELRPELANVLHSIHPGIRAVGTQSGDVVGFVPDLKRRGDGDEILREITRRMAEPVLVDGLLILLGPRVGGAVLDPETANVEDLLSGSKLALAETDASRVAVMFHPYQRARENRADEMARLLHQAVVNKQLSTRYQPDIDIETGRITAIKAYVHWEVGGSVILNSDLFAAATRASLHVPLGRQVMEEGLRQVYAWITSGLLDPVTLWLNVHPVEVLAPDFGSKMAAAAGVDERMRLGLELSEHPTEDEGYIFDVLRSLVAKGAEAAIGSFGSGRVDLSELQRLPFSTVKIDRRLTKQVVTNDVSAGFVGALVRIAELAGLSVTVQGVESAEQLAVLRSMGCRTAQGNLFARPLDAATMQQVLSDVKAGRSLLP